MLEGIIITIIGGLFLFFFGAYFKHRSQISDLQSANTAMLNEKLEPGKPDTESEKIISDLQVRIDVYENKETILAKYEKHKKGYFVLKKTKKPFCPVCLQKPKHFENQLTQKNDYFHCESCDYVLNPPFPDLGSAPSFRSEDF